MANQTTIGELAINLQIKLDGLEKGLEIAKKKLQEVENQNKEIQNSNKSLEGSYLAMSAVAVASLMKIGNIVKDSVEEYKEYTQAMSSLSDVADYTGNSLDNMSKLMNKYSKYMTKSDLAATIKNFSLMNMTMEQQEQIIGDLINSAIKNRNANYDVSTAVKVASDGYKQGLSTLSDSAGVTENLSVMQEKYAKSIGKTASQLTETEQNQAYVNRTMEAAAPFASAMADYTETLAGKQGEYNQAMRETQVAYAEALEPTLSEMTELKTQLIKILGNLINNNKAATAGTTAFITTVLTAIIAISGLTAAKTAYAKATGVATMSTKAFTAALLSNPITGIVVAIASFVAILASATTAAKEQAIAQANLNAETERYNQILQGTYGYTEKEISAAEAAKNRTEEQLELLQQQIEKQNEINNLYEQQKKYASYGEKEKKEDENYINVYDMLNKIRTAEAELKNLQDAYKEATKDGKKMGENIEELEEKLGVYNKQLEKSNAVEKISQGLDTSTIKKQQEEAAQLKVNANQMQKYLNVVKNGNKSTTEYQNAVKELSKAYPEAANAEGIIIDQAQNMINAEQLKADTAWKGSQDTIQSYIKMINAALQSESVQRQVAENIGIAYEEIKPKLEGVLGVLQTMANYQPNDVPNIAPASVQYSTPVSTGGGSSSYQNKALDNYKKQIEYKKALDKISLKQEISMYQTALKRYAKTQDEKWELQEKIYELQKELQEKTLDDYTSMIEHKKAMDQLSLQEEIKMYQTALKKYAKTAEQKQEIRETLYELNKEMAQKEKELLSQQTEDYEIYIEKQKTMRGASYTVEEQTSDYDKIIKMHKSYLEQIMKDERLSLDERKEIYREELSTIRQYEQQKRDLRVQAIDNTVSQLTNAITKQLEEMQNKEKDLLDNNLKTIEEWKDARINAINEEYDARIEAIEKELEALDKAEKQKTRDEEDADYEKKKKRLEDLIAFEHDATTKANYQKELDKLIAEHQKTLDKRELSDKKDALNEQKNLLKDEQDNKIKQIELETEKKKEAYDQQLKALEEYYNQQISKAEETAQQMLLNVEDNQNQIIALLQSYGDTYAITGQTFGEKLGQSFADTAMQKIQSAISQIQRVIDAAIASNIARLQASAKSVSSKAEGSTVINKTVNVEQNNTITSPVDSPSTAYKKQETLQRNLADSIATVF